MPDWSFDNMTVSSPAVGNAHPSATLQLRGHEDHILSAEFSPFAVKTNNDNDSLLLATGSRDGTARLWNVPAGKSRIGICTDTSPECAVVLVGHSEYVFRATFSPDASLVATASRDGTQRLWSVTGIWVAVWRGHSNAAVDVSFSPNGKLLATASFDETVRLWYVAALRAGGRSAAAAVLRGHTGLVWSAKFSPDGSQLVTGGSDQTARIWSIRDGDNDEGDCEYNCVAILPGHTRGVICASFSPHSGSLVVTASFDQTARLWSSITGICIAVLQGHTNGLWNAAFSPDGSHIVTASRDETARIWNVASQECVTVLEERGMGDVFAASFSPDGRTVVTGGGDGIARLWQVADCLLDRATRKQSKT